MRSDRGVPWYLAARRPGLATLAVEFVEVQRETEAAGYIPRGPDGQPVADLLVFTPKALREDPCIAMRKAFTKRQ